MAGLFARAGESESPSMRRTLALARKAAAADSSVLLLGETGVGKEWLARTIHTASPRAGGPFVAVNCAAFPETLLESELFGHERGAFTGADRARRGYFELAERGTLFLDEIAEMPPPAQAKLLRALQEREVRRLGSERPTPIDVRVLAATSRDLDAELASGAFRRELYFRLAVVTVPIPPLRERREDVPLLVRAYLDHFRSRLGRPPLEVTPEADELLAGYPWPGNVRELVNVAERAAVLVDGARIGREDVAELLPGPFPAPLSAAAPSATGLPSTLGSVLDNWLDRPLPEIRARLIEAFERGYLAAQLEQADGHLGETARRAGLDPRVLYDKMRALGLRKEDFLPARRRRPG